ncbi:ribokinase [Shewanella sp.]|uniref:ribokinase n=1 Tax=Shewanella sp. TaxID=50422 RepID=UPI004053E839
MSRLLILGSANVDHVMSFEYLPTIGQTLMSQDYRIEQGGKGANQAVAVARLCSPSTRVDFICHLGNDVMAHDMCHNWKLDGIQTDGVSKIQGQSTGSALIFIGKNGENSIGVAPGANDNLTVTALLEHQDLINRADWLLTQLESPTPTVIEALKQVKQRGGSTILNPAPAKSIGTEIYKWVDIITPNETEAEAITGIAVDDEDSAAFAAQMIHSHGPGIVIITLGARGAYVSSPEFSGLIPAPRVMAVDTVAAGDTFNGALLVGLSNQLTLVDAVTFANKAAAITVTRHGAQRSIPYRDDLIC